MSPAPGHRGPGLHTGAQGIRRRRRPTALPGFVVLALLLALAATTAVTPAVAQEGAPLSLSVHPDDGSARMVVGDLLDEGGLTRALHSGLPLRILVVAELWKDGFFDSQRGRAEWRATVLYDPLEERYRIATADADSTDVVVNSLRQVERTLQERFTLPLRPRESGSFYYLGEVEVETLSLSDLEELQQWLRGDLASAVSGEARVEDAVGSGVRRMLVRMLGLPARRFRVRTETFEIPDGPG